MPPPRILLCGDVLGRLNLLFKRVLTVNKSAGPFDALFCVGQFFPETSDQLEEFTGYVEGKSEIPIPTYFIGDYGAGALKILAAAAKEPGNQGFKMDGLKVCDNLYWLKRSGKFTVHGLCVTYLSGRQSTTTGLQIGTYNQDDVDALRALAEEHGIVDLFLTNEWPAGVTNLSSPSNIPVGLSDSTGSNDDSIVSELVTEIKPRYHIAGSKGVFYTREPYCNEDAAAVHVTRFVGLAQVGNKNKQKFMHALSPTPASTMSAAEISARPLNTTRSPFEKGGSGTAAAESTKRSLDGGSVDEAQYWRYDVKKRRVGEGGTGDKLCFKFLSSGDCPRGEDCHFRHDADAREQYRRGVCFDFLNKGKCERGPECQFKHNLVDEGETAPNRRRRPEGASRSRECWFCLSSPNVETHLIISLGENFYYALPKGPLVDEHVLIVPIEHFTSTLSSPSDCEQELDRFQSSLRSYAKELGKEMVFFELVSKRGTHANLQAIPIPSSRASAVKNIFNLAAKKLGFEFQTLNVDKKSLASQVDSSSGGLFYVEFPDGTILSHALTENSNFPVQFGREVLAGLLKMPEKADWRNCKLSKDEEVIMVERFKERFKRFDPNQ